MSVQILVGDAKRLLDTLAADSIQCCVTSPPYYGLRCYDIAGQIGLEPCLADYISNLVEVFRGVRRVLRPDGVCWINIGDTYARSAAKGGSGPGGKNLAYSDSYTRAQTQRVGVPVGMKPKDLMLVPFELALALRADGWYLRSRIIWHKPNAMPEPVQDRPVSSYEEILLLSKSERYTFYASALEEPSGVLGKLRKGRNVWSIPTTPSTGQHVAPFPQSLAARCIESGRAPGDVILDPFAGSGTTGMAARRLRRRAVLMELHPEFAAQAQERLDQQACPPPKGAGARRGRKAPAPASPLTDEPEYLPPLPGK